MRYELSDADVSRPDMTSSQPTIWRSLNSHQSEFGCALMSPRPSSTENTPRQNPVAQLTKKNRLRYGGCCTCEIRRRRMDAPKL